VQVLVEDEPLDHIADPVDKTSSSQTRLSIHPFICPSVYPYISIHPFIHLHLFMHAFIRRHVHPHAFGKPISFDLFVFCLHEGGAVSFEGVLDSLLRTRLTSSTMPTNKQHRSLAN
jgi:hypothetical protein